MDSIIENGKIAPIFSLPTLDGDIINLSDFIGKIVLINFWSAECPWAERADVALLTMRKKWGESVVWLSIASNVHEPLPMLRDAEKSRNIPLLLHDAKQEVATSYAAITTPHIFILDRKGVLQYQGAFNDVTFRQRTPSVNYAEEVIDSLINGQQSPYGTIASYGCTITYLN
jgi:peroxiredoxin